MRVKLFLAILFSTLLVMAAGCARTTSAPNMEATGDLPAGIPLAPDFRIDDIPVPAGFEIVREGTFVFQNPLVDVGRIRYLGKEPLTAVAQFYIDEMPRYGWKLVNIAEHETITLYYDKPDKTATVIISPKGSRASYIDVSFFPKSPKPAPSV
jgi:hypothetical protein